MLRFDDQHRTLELGVHDLLEAGQPRGDLSLPVAWSSSARARAGAAAHTRWQSARAAEDPGYNSEVTIRHRLLVRGWDVLISGRMDGLYDEGERRVVEEVKSTPLPGDRLEGLGPEAFPDWTRQLQIYLYFLAARGQDATGRLVVTSLYDGAWRVLQVGPDPTLGAFLTAQLDWILSRREARLAWLASRRGAPVPFAHDTPRPGQDELTASLRDALARGRQVLLSAPTGLGKTAAALHAALSVAAETDRRVYFATARTTQQRLALETVRSMAARGLPIRAITLRARDKVCLNTVVACRAETCRFAARYHDKVRDGSLLEVPWTGPPVDPETVVDLGRRHEVCPFALTVDLAAEADLVIGDYNYLFDPGARLSRLFAEGLDGWIVVVDEAHNLPDRGMSYASPALDHALAEAAAAGLEEDASARPFVDWARRTADWLEGGYARLGGEDPEAWGGEPLLAWTSEALAMAVDRELRETVRALADEAEALALPYAIRRLERLSPLPTRQVGLFAAPASQAIELDVPVSPGGSGEAERPPGDDPWQGLARGLLRLRSALDRAGEETVVIWKRRAGLALLCRDPSGLLGPTLAGLAAVVGMSGTLEPGEFYRDLLGLDPSRLEPLQAASTFPPEHRRVLVVPTVTTAFKHRARDREATAALITETIAAVPGNVAVFFSSFALRDELVPLLELEGRAALHQDRRMDEAARATLLDTLARGEGHVLFGVLGGIFSEGVDLPGAGLLAAIIVGPALPGVGLERHLLQSWYQERYGHGFRYAFLVPGLCRVVQAAGRVIRTPEDRGAIVLLDRRFLLNEYQEFFPADWSPVRTGRPAAALAGFWEGGEALL